MLVAELLVVAEVPLAVPLDAEVSCSVVLVERLLNAELEIVPNPGACQEFRVRAGRTSSQAAIAFEKRSANMTAI